MEARRALVRNAVGLAVAFWSLFWCLRRSEYERAPVGDAAYYTQMTWSFFSPRRAAVPISTIHSRRILGPFLAAVCLKLEGADTKPDFSFPYNPFHYIVDAWSREQRRAYGEIEIAWTLIDFISYLMLAAALGFLLPRSLGPRLALSLTAAMLLIPCLGLLYVYMPEMNDPLALGLAAAACALLAGGRELAGFSVLGLSALAREEILFLIPFFFLIRRPKSPALCLLASCALYAVFLAFPVFPNQQPLADNNSGIHGASPSALSAYASILAFHLGGLFSYKGLALPSAFALNLGPLLLLKAVGEIPRAGPFWPLAGLGLVFSADRHMVLLSLPLLLMASGAEPPARPGPLQALLLAWIGVVAAFLLGTEGAMILQTDQWFRFLSRPAFAALMSCLAALFLAVPAWARRR